MPKYILTSKGGKCIAKKLRYPIKIVTAENLIEAHSKGFGGWINPTTKRHKKR